jgi:O-antigen/teichoic acid export membrane protein
MTTSYDADGAEHPPTVHKKKLIRQFRLAPLEVIEDREEQDIVDMPDANLLLFADMPTLVLPRIGHSKGIASSNAQSGAGTSTAFEHDRHYSPLCDEETLILPVTHVSKTGTLVGVRGAEQQHYTAYIRNLITSSGIYALSSLASPLVSLVLAPFLTHHLTHTDYGALAVLNTAIALLAGITQLGLGSAFFRSYNYDYETMPDRLSVLSTTIVLLFGTSFLIAVIMLVGATGLATLLLGSNFYSSDISIAGVIILLQNLSIPGFAWLRAENRAVFFSLLSIMNLALSLGANIGLVGFLHMGIAGSLLATGCGYAFVALCTIPAMLWRAGLRPRLDVAQGLLSFGIPNATNFIAVWVLQLSDRFLLGRLGSLSQTASYAVAYSLGSIVNVVVLSPFTLAWPSAMFSIAKRRDAAKIFQTVFRWYCVILFLCAFALALVGLIVLTWFFPPSYHSAAPVIPTIVFSSVFYGLYNFFTTGISVRRQTWYAVFFTAASAIVNLALNLYLIPLYGSMGAAISTFIAYAVLAVIAYIVNQHIYPIPFEIDSLLIEMLVGLTLFISSTLLAQQQRGYGSYAIYGVALILYGIVLITFELFKGRIDIRKVQQKDFKLWRH